MPNAPTSDPPIRGSQLYFASGNRSFSCIAQRQASTTRLTQVSDPHQRRPPVATRVDSLSNVQEAGEGEDDKEDHALQRPKVSSLSRRSCWPSPRLLHEAPACNAPLRRRGHCEPTGSCRASTRRRGQFSGSELRRVPSQNGRKVTHYPYCLVGSLSRAGSMLRSDIATVRARTRRSRKRASRHSRGVRRRGALGAETAQNTARVQTGAQGGAS